MGARDRVCQVKVHDTLKSNNLSLIPVTHAKIGEKGCHEVVLSSIHTQHSMCTHTHRSYTYTQ